MLANRNYSTQRRSFQKMPDSRNHSTQRLQKTPLVLFNDCANRAKVGVKWIDDLHVQLFVRTETGLRTETFEGSSKNEVCNNAIYKSSLMKQKWNQYTPGDLVNQMKQQGIILHEQSIEEIGDRCFVMHWEIFYFPMNRAYSYQEQLLSKYPGDSKAQKKAKQSMASQFINDLDRFLHPSTEEDIIDCFVYQQFLWAQQNELTTSFFSEKVEKKYYGKSDPNLIINLEDDSSDEEMDVEEDEDETLGLEKLDIN